MLAVLPTSVGKPTQEGRNATVILSDIPAEYQTVSICFSRRGTVHGTVALWKVVEDGEIRIDLGTEFVPHTYSVDAIHIECRDSDNNIVSMMDNTDQIVIVAGENHLDRGKFVK